MKRGRWVASVLLAAGLVSGLLAALSGSASAQNEASVSLSKSASVSSVAPGTSFTYALRYSCSSLTTTCNGVTITDGLPPQLSRAAADVTLVGDSHTTGTAYDPATGTATFTMVSPMPAGTTGEVDITVKFPAGTTPVGASATNVATINAANAPSANSNPSTVAATVTPSIATTKALNATPIVLGAATSYTVSYTNSGNVNLTSPTLVDTLPAGATFVSASGGGVFDPATNQVKWTLTSPATPGTKSTQTVIVIYPSPPFTAGTPISNTVTGTGIPLGSTTPISQPATATATPVAPAPAVAASKSPSGPVALGRPFTYTVSVKNTGNVGLNPVTMLDTLPAGATFVSATGGGTYSAAAGTVSWTNPSPPLTPGATFTATVTVTYNSPPFTAGQVVTNNLSTSGTPVTGGPPVTGTASVTNTLAAPQTGGTITKTLLTPAVQFALDTPVQYQVTAKNTGDIPLAAFTITDPLPAGATFVSASNAGTYSPATNTVNWSLATPVAAGATQTVTVTVIYPSTTFTAGQLVTNTAGATGTANGTPVTIGPTSVTNPLQANSPTATVKKTATKPTVAIGDSDTYTITATNTGNVLLAPGFVVTDTLPDNLQPDSRPATDVTFTDTRGIAAARADTLAYHNPSTNAFVTVTATCTGSSTGTCSASIPTIADQIQVTYTGAVPVGFAGTATLTLRVPPNGVGRSGNPILSGDPIINCATVSASQLTATPQSCTAQTATAPLPTMTLTKTRTSPSPVPPPSPVSWQLVFGAPATSPAPILNPVLTDCLPAGLDLVDPANPGDPANGTPPGTFSPAPAITRVVNGCGTNTIEVIWSWAGSDPALSVPPGTTGTFTLNTQIQPGTTPKTLTNTASATADNNPTAVTSSASVVVASGASLESLKLVKGSLDSAYTKYPDIGHTTIGGSADYQLTVTNTGNIPINKVTVIDILPYVGDTAVLNAAAARDSAWSPILTGPVTGPAGVTVSYSTSQDPCRPELNYNPPGCVNNSFSATPPSPISSVASLKFSYAATLAPGQTLTLDWPMAAPPTAPVGSVAWNSFGFTGYRTDTGSQLTPAEPNKVGIEVNPYPLMLVKDVNDTVTPTPPGLYIPVGSPVTYTYYVTNPGDLAVGTVNLVDSPAQTITCNSPTIAPHSTITCIAAAGPATAGQHSDTATVTGQPLINGSPAGPPTAPVTATADYFGSAPAITVVKEVNGQPEPVSPGLYLPVGDAVTFTYVVTNTGNVTLNPVTLVDNPAQAIFCPETVLAPGDSETCSADGGPALKDQHSDTATATGQGLDNTGAPVGDPVSAADTAYYFGAGPAITVVKEVNRQPEPVAPGLYVPVGDPVTFSYVVTNTGNVTLDPVTVVDDPAETISCPQTSLALGDSETCSADGGGAIVGDHENTATATGQGVDNTGAPLGEPVTGTDRAYYFGSAPAIAVVKEVNGQRESVAPGLFVPVGDPVTFSYVVTNTGNVTLEPVSVGDDPTEVITCPEASLAPDVSETCRADGGPAQPDQHSDRATATGQGVDNTGAPVGDLVSAADTAYYFGAGPAITLIKEVNGQPEPNAPGLSLPVGDPVTFSYVVTNTGNVTLDPVTVVDDPGEDITCPETSLTPGESETCSAEGGAAGTGQHENTATATGQGVDNAGAPVGSPVTAADTAHYFGVDNGPAITLIKDVNGQHDPTPPGLYVPVGDPVTFTYLVTNTGNVTLDPVTVVDDPTEAITCPQTSLASEASMTCMADGGAAGGEHQNTATATGQGLNGAGHPIGAPVTATDSAIYFGSDPAITLVKDVNGESEPKAPGLAVPVGSTVTFTYLVTNTGNVILTRITVTDNVLGAITCPESSLAPSQSETCTKAATARPGAQTNIGMATAQPESTGGQPVGATTSATDPATYTGVAASTSPVTASLTTAATAAATNSSSPNGLGQIATDLGRWTNRSGPDPWAVAAGLGVVIAGASLVGARRRRRRPASVGDQESNNAQ